jgi:protein-S-isoprenylcysteine O-methyltransferase Ste14
MERFTWQFVFVCFLIFLIYWIIAAFGAKRTVEKQSRLQRILFLAVFLAAFLLVRRGGLLPLRSGKIFWAWTPAIGVLADAIVLGGLLILLWARVVLGGNWSASVVFKEGHELIERGPYAYVRHPIYSGMLLMVLGTAILNGRLGGFAALLIVFLGFWLKSRQEERLMTKHFPQAYAKYKARVKALVPGIF